MTEPSREILPRADGVREFGGLVVAGIADCAPSGRVRLDGLARWLQDVAYADVTDAGLESAAIWVVRRTRIRVARWPRFGERCALTTFCSGLGRMWAERRTDIASDGAVDVQAVSLWVHLDPERRLPSPLTASEVAAYSGSAAPRRVTARLRHPPPPSPSESATSDPPRSTHWRFRAIERDVAGHVNNAAYWSPLEEELLAGRNCDPPTPLDVELEYRTPAQPGRKRVLADGDRRWLIDDADGELHASFLLGGDG